MNREKLLGAKSGDYDECGSYLKCNFVNFCHFFHGPVTGCIVWVKVQSFLLYRGHRTFRYWLSGIFQGSRGTKFHEHPNIPTPQPCQLIVDVLAALDEVRRLL